MVENVNGCFLSTVYSVLDDYNNRGIFVLYYMYNKTAYVTVDLCYHLIQVQLSWLIRRRVMSHITGSTSKYAFDSHISTSF